MTVSTSEAVVSPACLTSRFHIRGIFWNVLAQRMPSLTVSPVALGSCGWLWRKHRLLGCAARCLPLTSPP